MKEAQREIITSREGSSMVSTWTEYLCVRRVSPGQGEVEICQYEALAEFEDTDEDGNDVEPPKEYDGKVVVGVEDGFLIGGELACWDDRRLAFGEETIDEALDWIASQHFKTSDHIRQKLVQFVA